MSDTSRRGWFYDFSPYDQALAFALMIQTDQVQFQQVANSEGYY